MSRLCIKNIDFYICKISIFVLFFCGINNYYIYPQGSYQSFNIDNEIITKPVSQILIVDKITLLGNDRTKDEIITRELTFEANDTISYLTINDHITKSSQNLLKTSLFNYVTIDTALNGNQISFIVNLEERWYFWPAFSITYADRNFSSWLKTKDFGRINYSLTLIKYNFRGRNEYLKFRFTTGYTQNFGIFYQNLFIDDNRKHALGADISFFKQKELFFETRNNKQQSLKTDMNICKWTEANISYTYRPKLYDSHIIMISNFYMQVKDSVIIANPDYIGKSGLKSRFNSISYEYRHDTRDLKYHPLTGHIFKLKLLKGGFDIFNDTEKFFSIYCNYNQYFALPYRFYWASGLTGYNNFNNSNNYLINKALGYKEDCLRGYEYYVVDGQSFVILKNNLKYNIFPPKIFKISSLPFKKFNKIHWSVFAAIFADLGYVHDRYNIYKEHNNNLVNSFLYSSGLSLEIVTYYDRILRIDLSINKMRETGIFFNFKAPIL